jgi:FkbM family methyltransferase
MDASGDGLMRVFLDVGAHVGETLQQALDPRYGFARVVCFEPVEACWPALERLADDRVEICRFGLWKETCRRPMYGAGSQGASLFPDSGGTGGTEVVELVRASEWFENHLTGRDEVYLKLNVEGSEADILDDLMQSGEIAKVRSALVDFDVRKMPSLAHREREIRQGMRDLGYSQILRLKEDHKGPTHASTVENWLRLAEVASAPPPALWSWRYVRLPAVARGAISIGKGLASLLLPQSVYERLRLWVQKKVYRYPPDASAGRRRRGRGG